MKRGIWAVIRRAFAGQWGGIGWVAVLNGFASVAEAAVIGLVALLVSMTASHKMAYDGSFSRLGLHVHLEWADLLALGAGVVLLRFVLQVLGSRTAARVLSGFLSQKREQLFEAFLLASWDAKQKTTASELQLLLTVNTERASGTLRHLTLSIVAAANAGVLFVAALLVNPIFVALNLLIAAVLFAVMRPMTRYVKRLTDQAAQTNLEYGQHVQESVALAREIEVFDVDLPVRQTVAKTVEKNRLREHAFHFIEGIQSPLYQNVVALAALGVLASVVVTGATNVEELGMFVVLMLRVAGYTQNLQQSYHQIVSKNVFLEQILDAEAAHQRGARRDGTIEIGKLERLSAQKLGFAYPGGKPVLDALEFEVSAGEMVGVVGPSGAGKSTLLKLLLGLHAPTAGAILVNGTPLTDVRRASWAKRVAFVPQEPVLLDASISENVRFFRPTVTHDAIEEACRSAFIHETIVGLPAGYGTKVGDRGGELSVGQRQRICIARALVAKPDLLILDEPTSALDAVSEQAIQAALDNLKGKTTVLIIAHRTRTLQACDRVLVLQDGRAAAFDAPQAVALSNPFFSQSLGSG